MNYFHKPILVLLVYGFAHTALAEPYNLPIQLDYSLIKKPLSLSFLREKTVVPRFGRISINVAILGFMTPGFRAKMARLNC